MDEIDAAALSMSALQLPISSIVDSQQQNAAGDVILTKEPFSADMIDYYNTRQQRNPMHGKGKSNRKMNYSYVIPFHFRRLGSSKLEFEELIATRYERVHDIVTRFIVRTQCKDVHVLDRLRAECAIQRRKARQRDKNISAADVAAMRLAAQRGTSVRDAEEARTRNYALRQKLFEESLVGVKLEARNKIVEEQAKDLSTQVNDLHGKNAMQTLELRKMEREHDEYVEMMETKLETLEEQMKNVLEEKNAELERLYEELRATRKDLNDSGKQQKEQEERNSTLFKEAEDRIVKLELEVKKKAGIEEVLREEVKSMKEQLERKNSDLEQADKRFRELYDHFEASQRLVKKTGVTIEALRRSNEHMRIDKEYQKWSNLQRAPRQLAVENYLSSKKIGELSKENEDLRARIEEQKEQHSRMIEPPLDEDIIGNIGTLERSSARQEEARPPPSPSAKEVFFTPQKLLLENPHQKQWTEVWDAAQQRSYYWNIQTGATSWKKPESLS